MEPLIVDRSIVGKSPNMAASHTNFSAAKLSAVSKSSRIAIGEKNSRFLGDRSGIGLASNKQLMSVHGS